MSAPLRPTRAALRPVGLGWGLAVFTGVAFGAAWAGAGFEASVAAMFGGALCVVSAYATWRHASSLRISAPPPVTAFAGERFALDAPVANLGRRDAFDVTFSPAAATSWKRVGALLPRLPAGEAARVEILHPALRRGSHPQGALEIASSFPLGLWQWRARFDLPERVLVLPRLGTLRRRDRRGARSGGDAAYSGKGRGDEQEVYGVRAWREGEALRAVHWKLSARKRRLLVREFRSEPRPPVHVVLDTTLPRSTRGARNAFEDAVTLAATLVEDQVRAGRAVRLTLLGRWPRSVVCPRGRGAVFPALRALAESEPEYVVNDAPRAMPRTRGRGEETHLVRVAPDAAAAQAPAGRDVVVYDVPAFDASRRGLSEFFDRRRRPGNDLLLGMRR